MKRKCAYCPRPATIATPAQIKSQGPLARLPHSVLKVKRGTPLPLCVAIRQGQAAQKRAERSFTEHEEDLEATA